MQSSHLVAIDPGIHYVAVTYWKQGRLAGGKLLPGSQNKFGGDSILLAIAASKKFAADIGGPRVTAVLEMPQAYSDGKTAQHNDIIHVAAVGAAVIAAWNPVEVVTVAPRDWKGQIPKPEGSSINDITKYIVNQRIMVRLTTEEKIVYNRIISSVHRNLQHNLVDSTGIGLWALERM
jgi:hypothetical protein